MSVGEAIVGIIIIGIFFLIIGSKVYKHEKEHLDPLVEKIKSWFHKEEDSYSSDNLTPTREYDLDFQGKMK